MKNKEFDNILNDCLERLLVKGESLEQCLESYPAQAAELKPLLETALTAREAVAIQPRPDFRAQASYQFRSALQERAAGKSRPTWGWFPRWATIVVIVVVLVLGGGGGTVAAADGSMPDSPLYPVKLATEQARLNLTFSQMGKARLCAELADRRVAEIAYMADKGDAGQVVAITRRLEDKLDLLVVLVGGSEGASGVLMAPPPEAALPPAPTTAPPTTKEALPSTDTDEVPHPPVVVSPPEETVPPITAVPQEGRGWGGQGDDAQAENQAQLRERLAYDAASNQALLNAALDRAPEQTRPALRQAIMVSEDGYDEALEALEQS
jgi:hypothetical protein